MRSNRKFSPSVSSSALELRVPLDGDVTAPADQMPNGPDAFTPLPPYAPSWMYTEIDGPQRVAPVNAFD